MGIIRWSELYKHLSPLLCGEQFYKSKASWCEEKQDIDPYTSKGIKFCEEFKAAHDEYNGFCVNIPAKASNKLAKIIEGAGPAAPKIFYTPFQIHSLVSKWQGDEVKDQYKAAYHYFKTEKIFYARGKKIIDGLKELATLKPDEDKFLEKKSELMALTQRVCINVPEADIKNIYKTCSAAVKRHEGKRSLWEKYRTEIIAILFAILAAIGLWLKRDLLPKILNAITAGRSSKMIEAWAKEWRASKESGHRWPMRIFKALDAFMTTLQPPEAQESEKIVVDATTDAPPEAPDKTDTLLGDAPLADPADTEPPVTKPVPDVRVVLKQFEKMIESVDKQHPALYPLRNTLTDFLDLKLDEEVLDDGKVPSREDAALHMATLFQDKTVLSAYQLIVDAYKRSFAERLPEAAKGLGATVISGDTSEEGKGTTSGIEALPDFNKLLEHFLKSLPRESGLDPYPPEWREAIGNAEHTVGKMREVLLSIRDTVEQASTNHETWGRVMLAMGKSSADSSKTRLFADNAWKTTLNTISTPNLSNINTLLPFAVAVNEGRVFAKEAAIITVGGLPDRDIPRHTQVDLLLVVYEAINNALRHSDGDVIRVHINGTDVSNLRITVSDNGEGFRSGVETTGTKVHSLAKAQGWDVEVVSRTGVNQGTTVTISIDTTSWPANGPKGGTSGGTQGAPPVAMGSQGGVPSTSGPGHGAVARSSTAPLGGIVYQHRPADQTSALVLYGLTEPANSVLPYSGVSMTALPEAGVAAFWGLQALPLATTAPPACIMPTMAPTMVPTLVP